eukprot:4033343-Pleurochrysis_carterae.AAC.1
MKLRNTTRHSVRQQDPLLSLSTPIPVCFFDFAEKGGPAHPRRGCHEVHLRGVCQPAREDGGAARPDAAHHGAYPRDDDPSQARSPTQTMHACVQSRVCSCAVILITYTEEYLRALVYAF